jgi:HSP20 family protein
MLKYHITRLPIATIPGGNPMSLLRWQPWQEVESLRRQFDQAFDELTHDTVIKSVNQVVRVPAIELTTTATHVILKAELPGIEAQDLDVQVTRDAISLKGEYRRETQDEHHQIHRTELRQGRFHRVIPLPVEVDNTQATAEFKQGLLTLTIAKYQDERTKAVKVAVVADRAHPVAAGEPAVIDAAPAPAIEPTPVVEPTPDPVSELPTDAWQ